jgi:TonB family protein
VRSELQGWINSRLLGLVCVGVLMADNAAISNQSEAADTVYMETKQPRDTRFITSISRLTACKITRETDVHLMTPLYPLDSRKHHEEGKVIMQFVIDSDSCVRKATILQSSGYYRLDKASLDFAMNLKLPASMLRNLRPLRQNRLPMERWSMGVTATGLPLERTKLGTIPFQVGFYSRTMGTR